MILGREMHRSLCGKQAGKNAWGEVRGAATSQLIETLRVKAFFDNQGKE